MKHLIFVLILAFCFQTVFFAGTRSINNNQLVTQLKVVEKDSTFWYLYVYDAGKKVMETKSYRADSTTWIRKSLTEWVYDGDNCISLRERVWRGYQWDFTYMIDYTYSNGLMQNETHSVWSYGIAFPVKKINLSYNQNLLTNRKEYIKKSDGYHLVTQTDFRYKADGKNDSTIISFFQADTLASKMLTTFGYSNNLLRSQLNKQFSGSGWVNTDSIYCFYYPNSMLVKTQKNKKWNSVTSAWENFQRIDYAYTDSNKILSESYQHWATMFWENDVKYDYIYNADNVLLKKSLSLPVYEEWRKTNSINYSDIIDSKANTINSVYEFWGGNVGDLTISFIPFVFNNELLIRRAKSIQLSYAQFNDTILKNALQSTSSINVYPNPSNGIFYINVHEKTLKSWIICDLNGRVMKKSDRTYQSSVVDITDLPKGVYLLKVMTDDSSETTKIIRQ